MILRRRERARRGHRIHAALPGVLLCARRTAPTCSYDLFVTPAARGTGAGRSLMEAAEAHGRKTGAARLQLQTAVTNTIGQSLYESCDWVRDDLFYTYEKSRQTLVAEFPDPGLEHGQHGRELRCSGATAPVNSYRSAG